MAISPTENEVERETNIKKGFLRITGGLMYAMVMTRCDIAFHVSHLSRCMQSPSTEAYEALLNVLAYAYHSRDIGITYGKVDESRAVPPDSVLTDCTDPRTWHDASFGGKQFDPYGGGYVEFNHAAVIWIARTLKFKPTSVWMAELGAMVVMAKETIFTTEVLTDMGIEIVKPTTMLTDSKSTSDTVQNAGATKMSISLERWMHYARDLVLRGKIKSKLVRTEHMMADDKTKAVDRKKFFQCRRAQMNLPSSVVDPP